MSGRARLGVVGACLAGAAIAQAAPASPTTTPPKLPTICKGCTLDAPAARDEPMPLLVVLHGDREHAAAAAARWRAAAKQRGFVLLSLQCPADEGCKDSWWQWNGDPAWVRARVADVAAALPIDPHRVFLAGWSGGATYLGMHAPAWSPQFAAVVVHGGGHSPQEACPAQQLPAYFLVGDKNPLHYLMKELRDWFTQCHGALVWDLVAGGDHAREERALDRKKALAILDWLSAHVRQSRD